MKNNPINTVDEAKSVLKDRFGSNAKCGMALGVDAETFRRWSEDSPRRAKILLVMAARHPEELAEFSGV